MTLSDDERPTMIAATDAKGCSVATPSTPATTQNDASETALHSVKGASKLSTNSAASQEPS